MVQFSDGISKAMSLAEKVSKISKNVYIRKLSINKRTGKMVLTLSKELEDIGASEDDYAVVYITDNININGDKTVIVIEFPK